MHRSAHARVSRTTPEALAHVSKYYLQHLFGSMGAVVSSAIVVTLSCVISRNAVSINHYHEHRAVLYRYYKPASRVVNKESCPENVCPECYACGYR